MYLELVLFLFTFCVITHDGECIVGQSNVIKLSNCEACERLVESFVKGIERTEKENHAGGNTAWEEAQLGSYSNSEVRFVEIQEGLCEDNRTTMDQCQALAEEFEEYLEQWWVEDRWDVPDLRYYLCVKKTKSCDSSPSSQPPAAVDGYCPDGWEPDASGVCEDMNECLARPCEDREYCMNTAGSYACHPCHDDCLECVGPGENECKVYRSLLDNFIANLFTLYRLSMVGPTFIVTYVFIILCANLVFKIPLMPSVCLLCLVICVGVKYYLDENHSDSS